MAGMIDEMGLVDAINQLVSQHPLPKSALVQGRLWSAMILNVDWDSVIILMPSLRSYNKLTPQATAEFMGHMYCKCSVDSLVTSDPSNWQAFTGAPGSVLQILWLQSHREHLIGEGV